ncbi:MAG: hypothetical protein ACO2PN_21065 [Pyrobaculum sp.]|jgi:hypothetical protein
MKTQNNVAPQGVGAVGAGLATEQAPKIPAFEVDEARSYMFEVETKEVLHLDRLGADDIVRTLEKMAVGDRTWVCSDGDVLIIKLGNGRQKKVKIMRDAVAIKAGDYALVADDKFLLMRATEDGFYELLAKGDEITWDGTEEYFTPSDVRRHAMDVAKRVLGQARFWI